MSEWVLPPGLKRALSRVLKRSEPPTVPPSERAVLTANARLQGAYAGRKCFVLGNGPSLAAVDISGLGDEVTVVMNEFNRHAAMRHWQPTVHCVGEPASAYTEAGALGIEFLRELLEGYTATTHVFPIEMKDLFDRTGLLPPDRLVLVKQDGRVAAEFDHIDLTGPIPSVHDTSILAVSVAIAMGCTPIVLLGLDYNWLSLASMGHFYDDSAAPRPAGAQSRTPYVDLPYLDKMVLAQPRWEAHAALRRIAARQGQVILNATAGSYLDAYPFAELEDVLAGGV